MDYIAPLRDQSFQAQAIHALRQLRYCGDAYPAGGWPVVNRALAQYALERWRAREDQRELAYLRRVCGGGVFDHERADANFDDMDYDPATEPCHYCHGDGCGIVGLDWDCADAVNGPYDGDFETCPCCGGSGKEENATFW